MSKLTLSFKGMELKVITLVDGEMIIGSDPACSIHIDSLAVHPQHTSVFTDNGTAQIKDLGTPEGTYVNNERIAERTLKDGDVIRVGKHTLAFRFQAGRHAAAEIEITALQSDDEPDNAPETSLEEFAANAKQKTGWLQIMTGHNVGKNISLNRKLTNLGTPGIQTAVIAKRNEGYYLSHLEGEHPPKVGDQYIGDKTWPLNDGDVIQIGNVRMQFYLQ